MRVFELVLCLFEFWFYVGLYSDMKYMIRPDAISFLFCVSEFFISESCQEKKLFLSMRIRKTTWGGQ